MLGLWILLRNHMHGRKLFQRVNHLFVHTALQTGGASRRRIPATCFNRMEQCEKNPDGPNRIKELGRHKFKPFRYRHLRQFAPLGGDQTATKLPYDIVSIGRSTQWLWYSIYASKQVSWRTRVLVVSDWGRRFISEETPARSDFF